MTVPTARDRRALRWALFLGLAGGIIVVDQVSKRWVDANFSLAWLTVPIPGYAPPTPIIGDLVRIAKSYNDGGLFGLFGTGALLLAVASMVVIGLILWFERRAAAGGPLLLTITLGLLLGGAVGNLLDRLRLGYVIDFVDMGIGDHRFFTFNVADSAISLAIAGLLLLSLFGDRLATAPPARPETVDG
ncbi:MAG: signal peptidase II [Candidatus Limnocylindrales bacterium]